ncbi:MAG: YybS family protein [Deltaproteobacteria bacterium]|nr:YybS family protein [Deltaproteobacteria bacterium]
MVLPLHREFFSAVALTSLVFIAVTTLSIASTFGAVLTPIPLLYYYSRLGRMQGVMVFLSSLVIVMLVLKITGSQLSIFNLVLLGSLGPILSEVLRKNYSIEKTIACSVSAMFMLGLCFLLYFSLSSGKAPWHIVEAYITELVQTNVDTYARIGTSPEQLDMIRNNMVQISKVLTELVPSFFLVGTSFFVWLNILIGKVLFRSKGMWYPDFGNLSTWKIPDKVVWIVISAGLSILIPFSPIRILGVNIVIIMLFAYMMQGLSIINFFFDKKNLPWFLRAIGYFLIFVQQFLLIIVIGLGLIDVWVNFRKLDKAK